MAGPGRSGGAARPPGRRTPSCGRGTGRAGGRAAAGGAEALLALQGGIGKPLASGFLLPLPNIKRCFYCDMKKTHWRNFLVKF